MGVKGLTPGERDSLIAAATAAREKAAAPYSHFHVGAALLSEDGRVFGGCNVESASFGLTNCAERTAVFKAVSEGVRRFRAVAVVTAADEPIFVRPFFDAGGRGYVTKACRPSEVFSAIRQVVAGHPYVAQALSQQMTIVQLRGPASGSPFKLLSGRQFAVIQVDLTGPERTDAMIGAKLGITAPSVAICIS